MYRIRREQFDKAIELEAASECGWSEADRIGLIAKGDQDEVALEHAIQFNNAYLADIKLSHAHAGFAEQQNSELEVSRWQQAVQLDQAHGEGLVQPEEPVQGLQGPESFFLRPETLA